MSDRGLHYIANDLSGLRRRYAQLGRLRTVACLRRRPLSDTWLEDWAGVGMAEIEAYLAKHAEFLRFLDSQRWHD
jgi:hypothetical protein